MSEQRKTGSDISTLVGEALRGEDPDGLVSAYLFGSFAEGREHRESDIDVGVLLRRDLHPDPKGRFRLRLHLSSALTSALGGRTADVVILNDAPPGLARRIVTEGPRILCTDEGKDHDFVRDIQLLAADLEPFLRRMRKIELEDMVREHDQGS
jgi:predicted nucleotidyltransferase